jgi:DNA-binding NtrC family response regulator
MKKKVLVVDDDDSVRESLKKVLQDAGYDVVLAAGGLEAATRFEPAEIDLLLLDLNLPNQSGWDLFEHLTTRHPFVPVIIITGMPNQYRTALAAGAGALFEKPVEVPTLLKTMEDLLAEPNEQRLRRLCGHMEDTRYTPAAKTAWRQSQPEHSTGGPSGRLAMLRSSRD